MKEERQKILAMLAEGKITPEEAEKLLEALGTSAPDSTAGESPRKKHPRWLRIQVDPRSTNGCQERVNIRVPLMLLRTGLKLGALLPGSVRGRVSTALGEQGIDVDLSNVDAKTADELVNALSELNIDVEADDHNIRICCE